jgi:hypothetical protein
MSGSGGVGASGSGLGSMVAPEAAGATSAIGSTAAAAEKNAAKQAPAASAVALRDTPGAQRPVGVASGNSEGKLRSVLGRLSDDLARANKDCGACHSALEKAANALVGQPRNDVESALRKLADALDSGGAFDADQIVKQTVTTDHLDFAKAELRAAARALPSEGEGGHSTSAMGAIAGGIGDVAQLLLGMLMLLGAAGHGFRGEPLPETTVGAAASLMGAAVGGLSGHHQSS